MACLEEIILKPLITEKTSVATDKLRKYGFVVAISANKNQIKLAVEKLYDVRVIGVQTAVSAGKPKRYGRFSAKGSKSKKAFVQLAEGQKIEFFKGV